MKSRSIILVVCGVFIGFFGCRLIFSAAENPNKESVADSDSTDIKEERQFLNRDYASSLTLVKNYINKLKIEAIQGSSDSAKELFYYYTFCEEYQKSFFWASYYDNIKGESDSGGLSTIAIKNLEYQVKEIESLKLDAVGGSLDAARRLFTRLTFHDRDHEAAFFWAVLIKDLGDHSDKGDIREMAKRNAESNILSGSD